MLNLLTKTKPWMVASLIVATSLFGQTNAPSSKTCPPKQKPCPQPCPPTQVCSQDPCCPGWPTPVLNAAYNYPARIQTRCPWDVYFDASFIYWQPMQDNMEIGFSNTTATSLAAGLNGNFINMDFGFSPGFKVGLGGNFAYDNWDMHLEYTWFHTRNSQNSTNAIVNDTFPTQGHPSSLGMNTSGYTTVDGKWKMFMDIIDLDLGRWEYVGTSLVVRPSVGARVNWIRQQNSTTYTKTTDIANVYQKTSSYGIGPKFALDSNWNMGYGFRFYGNAEADLLFTNYTRLRTQETHTANTTPIYAKQSRVYAVRPHLDFELGFGWGTYLDCNNWYMDFTAGYGFQVFFDQNMFRQFNSSTMYANSTLPNGNLYVQGLTITFKLDF